MVAGDSAGGNLAAVSALRARDSGGPRIALQVLVYPVTDCDLDRRSYHEYDGDELIVNRRDMAWFWDHYAPDPAARVNPYASPLRASDLAGLPPAYVVTAEHDPLRDEGFAYADRLRAARVPVEHRHYGSQIHGFFTFVNLLDDADKAVAEAGAAIRSAVGGRGHARYRGGFREAARPLAVTEVEIDAPGPGEALVKIVASGVCHTDALARDGDMPFPAPGVLGHEGAGVVAAVGDGVTNVAVGDKVVIGWPWCGSCRNCLEGQPRYCLELGPLVMRGARADGSTSLRRLDGSPLHSHFFGQSSFASYSICAANALVLVAPDAPVALLGPLACGISTGAGAVLNALRPGAGSSIVVYGAGAVGLSAVMAARLTGATSIIAVDRLASRLSLARELGATETIDVSAGVDPVAAVHEICGGPADFSLDCAGNVAVLRQAADSVGMRGTVALIGGAPAGASFSLDHMSTLWGKRVIGTLGGEGRSVADRRADHAEQAGPVPVRPADRDVPAGAGERGARGVARRRRDQAGAADARLTAGSWLLLWNLRFWPGGRDDVVGPWATIPALAGAVGHNPAASTPAPATSRHARSKGHYVPAGQTPASLAGREHPAASGHPLGGRQAPGASGACGPLASQDKACGPQTSPAAYVATPCGGRWRCGSSPPSSPGPGRRRWR